METPSESARSIHSFSLKLHAWLPYCRDFFSGLPMEVPASPPACRFYFPTWCPRGIPCGKTRCPLSTSSAEDSAAIWFLRPLRGKWVTDPGGAAQRTYIRIHLCHACLRADDLWIPLILKWLCRKKHREPVCMFRLPMAAGNACTPWIVDGPQPVPAFHSGAGRSNRAEFAFFQPVAFRVLLHCNISLYNSILVCRIARTISSRENHSPAGRRHSGLLLPV
jgi:hypothetical protein